MSQVVIRTTDGKRIAKRLINHWRHKFKVTQLASETNCIIHMPDAEVLLAATDDMLIVQLNTEDKQADLTHLEQVVADHIDRMADQKFHYHWHAGD